MKYRKKPIEVEAWQWDGRTVHLPEWCKNTFVLRKALGELGVKPTPWTDGTWSLLILTEEGSMQCSPGDWVIRGIEGELYPCKDSVFQKTYEVVE